MYGSDGPDAFWLDFTNIALGLVTLLCAVVIVAGVIREIVHRLVRGKKLTDEHAFKTPGRGLTMADGGERVDGEGRKEPE